MNTAAGVVLPLVERAPAKINLTLAVTARRDDGFHALESLAAFAGVHDRLAFAPGGEWALTVRGAGASALAGPDNLVLKAARALQARLPDVARGRFTLEKRLPVAAGIGGGSSDAAAALRLVARASGLAPDHPALLEAAAETGSDVPVCLSPRARMFRGRGEEIGAPLGLPPLAAVLANPGVALSTPEVFGRLGLARGEDGPSTPGGDPPARMDIHALMRWIAAGRNDLEAPAEALCPEIARLIHDVAALPGCLLARMSGSGATVFGLFHDRHAASAAARHLKAARPDDWIVASLLR